MNTVRELLARARARLAGTDEPALESQVLLGHLLGRDRGWLFAWPEHQVTPRQSADFDALLERRAAGEPVAHITGVREFWSMPLRVDASTLVPRAETELLVETVLELSLPDDARVLDLGTGSGAVALAIAGERPGWQIVASDCSTAALAVARDNAQRLGRRGVAFRHGRWFEVVQADERFDLVVSNPPYVADDDPHLVRGDLRFEPRSALAAGSDGLDDIREIVAAAPRFLADGGWLWLEHGYDQGAEVCRLLSAAAFQAVTTRHDLGGHGRCSGGRTGREAPA